ncbi:chemotaxis protein CheW [Geotalea toluenoxydans]
MQNEQGSTQSGEGEEYLTFTLGKEEYGMDILKVQEIRGYDAVTHIANSPDFLKGVINLRGVIVPIVDMRIKFNLGNAVYNEFTVVIIINVAGRVVGMVVDGVSDVISLAPEQVKAAPEFSSGLDTRYITGLGTINDQMLILVDIERLMSSPEMQLMNNAESMLPSALPVDTKTAQGEQLCNGSTI